MQLPAQLTQVFDEWKQEGELLEQQQPGFAAGPEAEGEQPAGEVVAVPGGPARFGSPPGLRAVPGHAFGGGQEGGPGGVELGLPSVSDCATQAAAAR